MCRRHGVRAVYVGHDHDNDFVAHWHHTRLAYGCALSLQHHIQVCIWC